MEDSSEMHFEESKVSLEKNVKRRFKTQAQVMALENFYNEHKYPSEEMKMQLSEQIGLTEKQISGWFCHRRLKDKKIDEGLASGRQDRSSVIIQDRGSGLWQDSCGSTKQGDIRTIDPREVESRRLSGQDAPSSDLVYDYRSQYTGHISGMERDDTSSESSSFLQDRIYSRIDDLYTMEASRYNRQNGAITPINCKATRSKEYKPSGYLKVRGETENAAITAVKIQLGRQYREDGPLLGIEFDPLPPGAFESPSNEPVNEPSHVEESSWPHSLDVPGVEKRSDLGTRYEVRGSNSKMEIEDSYIGSESLNTLHGSDCHGMKSYRQSKQKSSHLCYSNFSPGPNSKMDVYEDSAGETPIYNANQGYKLSSKYDAVGNSVLRDHHCRGVRITNEQMKPLFHDYNNINPKIVQNSDYLSKPSNMTLGSSNFLDAAERITSKRIAKVEKLFREKKVIKENHDPVAKRQKVGLPRQDNLVKSLYGEIPRWRNQIKGFAADMPSSFSEDETAETSSSME
ncbi:homeobox-DDT domain protein RLT1-like isoform X3 [Mangifera indica]|uniref:homeobox-DDT domain protein RLT1-like isoform X3 n=1 Tax=Mangifera indica TaxID=29780 RepID=UPI001CF9CD55|nr:homeobox-DDT domain protein RLT1-like isoform X3 [Mangifera indica]